MIRLYRISHSPKETRLTWQGESDDVLELSKVLRVTPQKSKLQHLFELGYFAYLRGSERQAREQAALKYLSTHFSPPQVEILVFRGDQRLSEKRNSQEWQQFIEKRISDHFESKGFPVVKGETGYTIYGLKDENRLKVGEELYVRRGISVDVKLNSDSFPLIYTDVTYRLEYRGTPISERQFQQVASRDSLVLRRNFSFCDTDEIVDLCSKFIASLPKPIAEACSIEPHPRSANELSLETWLWAHHAPLDIEIAKGQKVTLAQTISEERGATSGLYNLPRDEVAFILVFPSSRFVEWTKITDWSVIEQLVKATLSAMLPEKDLSVKCMFYDGSDESTVVQTAEEILNQLKGRKVIFALVSPPEDSDSSGNSELRAIDRFTNSIQQRLRKLQYGGYLITLDWEQLSGDEERHWIVENAILKSLTVLGATPWRVIGVPFDNGLSVDEVCFIGIDVNIYKKVPRVGGVIVDGYGVARGYHIAKLPYRNGDYIDPTVLALLLPKLVNHYKDVVGYYPKHVYIHRDGLVTEDDCQVAELFLKHGMGIDLLEIRKSGAPRLRQPANSSGTPSRDIAVGNLHTQEAYLMTTFVRPEKVSKDTWIFPAPEPIAIRRAVGGTSLKTLAGQVYALTQANYSSYRRTNRLPITIDYADALVNRAAELKQGQEDDGKSINGNTTLYWL